MDLGIGIVIIVVTGLIAITSIVVAIRVDFVELLKFHHKRRIERAQRTCPHIDMRIDDATNNVGYQSLFISPPGTVSWICTRCNLTVLSEVAVKQNEAYWLENWSEWPKQMKKFSKLVDKL